MSAPRDPASILVYVGLDLMGDGLMKLPFVRALRAAFPKARIVWLAGKGRTVYAGPLKPLVAGLIDEIIEAADIGSRWTELFRRPLAGREFDLVIDTQRRVLTTLILRRLRCRRFLSPAANFTLSGVRPPTGYDKPSALNRQLLDLVEFASGRPATPHAAPPLPAELVEQVHRLLPDGPVYIGLAPGAGNRAKCWPLAKFIELARGEGAKGRVPVFILGPEEDEWAAELQAALPGSLFPLQDAIEAGTDPGPLLTIALTAQFKAAVANDSGGGHMLAAGGAPLVSLFGPTRPEKFAPLARRPAIVRAQDFGGAAMEAIPVSAVAAAIDRLLA